jgi:hypothetical protein
MFIRISESVNRIVQYVSSTELSLPQDSKTFGCMPDLHQLREMVTRLSEHSCKTQRIDWYKIRV